MPKQDWTGATSTDGFNDANWTLNHPVSGHGATIDTVTPNPTVVSAPGAQAALLFVGLSGTGTLTILNGGTVNFNAVSVALFAGSNSPSIEIVLAD